MSVRRLPDYLRDIQIEVEEHARSYGLDFFPTVYEVLDYKTMNEVAAYAATGSATDAADVEAWLAKRRR